MTHLRRITTILSLAGAFVQLANAQPGFNVVLQEAKLKELPATTTLVGSVEPLTRSLIGSEIAGIVQEMPVRQGDRVEKGQLLVKLNDDILRFRHQEAVAILRSRRAQLRRWEFEKERVEKLFEVQQANDKEISDTLAAYDMARFDVDEQDAIVGRTASDLSKTEINAPFSGVIIRRDTEVGQWIPQGGSIAEIADLSSVLVRVDVPEYALPYIKIDATVSVKVDALNSIYDGKIQHIIRQADPNARTFPVEIVIDNSDQTLSAGMFVRATVVSGERSKMTAVPKDAIVIRDGIAYIAFVMPGRDGFKGMLTPVTTGADIGDWIAIKSGKVAPGSKVITRGNEWMQPFPMSVNIVDERGNPVASPPGAGHGERGGGQSRGGHGSGGQGRGGQSSGGHGSGGHGGGGQGDAGHGSGEGHGGSGRPQADAKKKDGGEHSKGGEHSRASQHKSDASDHGA